MKRHILFPFFVLVWLCLTGCEKYSLTSKNVLVFKPASSLTRSNNSVEDDGSIVYKIGCAWSGLSGPTMGGEPRGIVTSEFLFEEGDPSIWEMPKSFADLEKISPLVSVLSVHYSNNSTHSEVYSKKYPDNIQLVYIYGEPARLFGGSDCLAFLINQDPYGNDRVIEYAKNLRGQNLDNELIAGIRFKTYKITFDKDTETSYANIDIIITSKKGDVIRIVYSGELLPEIGINSL